MVRFYRHNKGLEVDAVVESQDGRWTAVTAKLGSYRMEEGARHLLALRGKASDEVAARCEALVVVVAEVNAALSERPREVERGEPVIITRYGVSRRGPRTVGRTWGRRARRLRAGRILAGGYKRSAVTTQCSRAS